VSTKLSNTDRYPATPAQIMAMLSDPEYAKAKYTELGDVKFTVAEHKVDGDNLTVKVEREVTSNMPGAAKKVLGETSSMVQTENWKAAGNGYACEMSVESPGKPLVIKVTQKITAAGDTDAEWVADFDIKASIPMLGGKIEKMVAEETKDSLAKEFAFNKEWLASH